MYVMSYGKCDLQSMVCNACSNRALYALAIRSLKCSLIMIWSAFVV